MCADRDDRWQHLVAGAFRIDEAPSGAVTREALAFLNSVLEVFPATVDPLDDFEGYAVRRVAKSLVRALERQNPR